MSGVGSVLSQMKIVEVAADLDGADIGIQVLGVVSDYRK
jgi:hypothetical protein